MPREYDVEPIVDDATARAFILQHHYSQSYPAARWRFALHRRGALVGVAVFSVPANARSVTSVFPGDWRQAPELGRFVLVDEVPANGETWFLARCFEQLRRAGLAGVISYSDPVPRTTADGARFFPGHVGTIYQAHNAAYLGRGTARTLALLPDGRAMSPRAIQKIRAGERGWRGAAAILEGLGADPCPEDDRRSWLRSWLPRLTRPLAHGGNHKYAWTFTPRALDRAPYPKQADR